MFWYGSVPPGVTVAFVMLVFPYLISGSFISFFSLPAAGGLPIDLGWVLSLITTVLIIGGASP